MYFKACECFIIVSNAFRCLQILAESVGPLLARRLSQVWMLWLQIGWSGVNSLHKSESHPLSKGLPEVIKCPLIAPMKPSPLKLLLFFNNITIISPEVNFGSHFSKKKEAVVNYLKKKILWTLVHNYLNVSKIWSQTNYLSSFQNQFGIYCCSSQNLVFTSNWSACLRLFMQIIRQHRLLRGVCQSDPRLRDGDAGAHKRLPPRVFRLSAVQSQVSALLPLTPPRSAPQNHTLPISI